LYKKIIPIPKDEILYKKIIPIPIDTVNPLSTIEIEHCELIERKHLQYNTFKFTINGMPLLIYQLSKSVRSSFYLGVGAGALTDETNSPGRAHLAEHMAASYLKTAHSLGGESNASTYLESTLFFIDQIPTDKFQQAANMLINSVMKPRFMNIDTSETSETPETPETLLKKEKETINREYETRSQTIDHDRETFHHLPNLLNQTSPFYGNTLEKKCILCGNGKSLEKVTKEDLASFYRTYYHAENMAAVCYTNQSVSELQWLFKLLEQIPQVENASSQRTPKAVSSFDENLADMIVIKQSVGANFREMRIDLFIPSELFDSNDISLDMTLSPLEKLFSYEGPNGITSELQAQGLITRGTNICLDRSSPLISILIHLTEKGVAEWPKIVKSIYSILYTLKTEIAKKENVAVAFSQFRENCLDTHIKKFELSEGMTSENLSTICQELFIPLCRDSFKTYPSNMFTPDKKSMDVTEQLFQALDFNKANIYLACPSSENPFADQPEFKENIDPDMSYQGYDVSEVLAPLRKPEGYTEQQMLSYIPSFTLHIPEYQEILARSTNSDEMRAITSKEIEVSDSGKISLFRLTDRFPALSGDLRIDISSDFISNNWNILTAYIPIINLIYREENFLSNNMNGLKFSIECDRRRPVLTLNITSREVSSLLIEQISGFIEWVSKLNEHSKEYSGRSERYESIINRCKEELTTVLARNIDGISRQAVSKCLTGEMYRSVKDTKALLDNGLKFNELCTIIQKMLKQYQFHAYAFGNFSKELLSNLSNELERESKKHDASHPVMKTLTKSEEITLSCDSDENMVTVVIPQASDSLEQNNLYVSILEHIMYSKFFDFIRTKNNLSYNFGIQSVQIYGHANLQFVVKSNVPTEMILQKIKEFMANNEWNFTEEEFELSRRAIAVKLNSVPENRQVLFGKILESMIDYREELGKYTNAMLDVLTTCTYETMLAFAKRLTNEEDTFRLTIKIEGTRSSSVVAGLVT
jgi:secreted Zn-dependent insulinase-like peptidase